MITIDAQKPYETQPFNAYDTKRFEGKRCLTYEDKLFHWCLIWRTTANTNQVTIKLQIQTQQSLHNHISSIMTY